MIPWSPLSSGLLGGVLDKIDEGRRAHPTTVERAEKQRVPLVAWEGLCRDLGEAPADVALAWLLAQGDNIAPIPGTKRVTYLEENAAAADIELSADEVSQIDVLFAAENIAGERDTAAGMRSLDRD